MKIGTAIAIVGVWFALVAAFFVTKSSEAQAAICFVGFPCVLIATVLILLGSGEKTVPANESDEKDASHLPPKQ